MLDAIGKPALAAQIADRLDTAFHGPQQEGNLRPPAAHLHQEPIARIVIYEQQRFHRCRPAFAPISRGLQLQPEATAFSGRGVGAYRAVQAFGGFLHKG